MRPDQHGSGIRQLQGRADVLAGGEGFEDMSAARKGRHPESALPGAARHLAVAGQLTLTAVQAAATALYSVLPEP